MSTKTKMHPLLHRESSDHSSIWYVVAAVASLGTLAYLYFVDNPVTNIFLTLIRTPQSVFDAVTAVDPENNPDLQPGANGGAVWCNKALYLMLQKLGVTLPWAQWGTLVDAMISYVAAGNDGWYPVPDLDTATQIVASGQGVAIATYYNTAGSGHGALVLPDGYIAQAGEHNYNHATVAQGFGGITPVYFAHP